MLRKHWLCRGHYSSIPDRILAAPTLSPTAKLVLIAIGRRVGPVNTECWPTMATIAKDIGGVKLHTIGRAVKELATAGYISIRVEHSYDHEKHRPRTINYYSLMSLPMTSRGAKRLPFDGMPLRGIQTTKPPLLLHDGQQSPSASLRRRLLVPEEHDTTRKEEGAASCRGSSSRADHARPASPSPASAPPAPPEGVGHSADEIRTLAATLIEVWKGAGLGNVRANAVGDVAASLPAFLAEMGLNAADAVGLFRELLAPNLAVAGAGWPGPRPQLAPAGCSAGTGRILITLMSNWSCPGVTAGVTCWLPPNPSPPGPTLQRCISSPKPTPVAVMLIR